MEGKRGQWKRKKGRKNGEREDKKEGGRERKTEGRRGGRKGIGKTGDRENQIIESCLPTPFQEKSQLDSLSCWA